MKKITQKLMFLLLFVISFGYSQKVAVIGMNHVSTLPATDGFTFLVTQDLVNGEVIYFTENEYNNVSNVFTDTAEGVVVFTATSAIPKGNVVFVNETATNTFTVTCTSGVCGTAVISGAGAFAIATDGETLYAYSDSDNNPANGVTTIHSVMFTGDTAPAIVNGGPIPTAQDPTPDFPNAIVIDGFPAVQPDRVEFNPTAPARTNVTKVGLENPSNYVHAQANAALSTIFFTNFNISGSNPVLTVTASPTSVAENSGTGMVYTFSLSANATSNITVNFNVGGSATFSIDYTQTGATTFNASTGTVTILSGSNSATITVTPTGDTDLEPNETVVLTLTAGTGYDAGSPGAATTTILNDDTSNADPLVALTGISHTDPDGFSFVAVSDIPANTVVYFTENSFNNTTLSFGTGEAVLQWTSPASVIPKGNVIVVTETAPDTFAVTCSSGGCGTIALLSGNLAVATTGETKYAYSDSDANPSNGVTAIYSVLFTGTSTVSGGAIPAIEDPSTVYTNAVVVDGFPATAPLRTEYDPTKRAILVTEAVFEDVSNWIHGQAPPALSTVPFALLNISCTTPPTPTFTQVGPICLGDTLSALPTTSLNGIMGTWAPALNDMATTTYTFTPDLGQCGTTTTMTIVVNPILTPTFNPVAPICFGDVLAPLPLTSNNGISGTWSPALNSASTTTYIFTPDVGQCGTTTTLTITVDSSLPPVTPNINVVVTGGCSALTATFNAEGLINGKASYAFFNPGDGEVYRISYDGTQWVLWCCADITFTGFENTTVLTGLYPPTTGWVNALCFDGTLTINGGTNFTVCEGTTFADLPVTGPNLKWYDSATNGNLIPSSTVITSGSYYVSQMAASCESIRGLVTVTVTPSVTPTFTQVAPICSGETLSALPTTSNNGIMGTWAPALNNTATTTYTFTPNAGVCAPTATMTIIVNPAVNNTTTVTACDTYTWPFNSTTYTTSGVYTVPVTPVTGIINNLANWTSAATSSGATINSNGLSGFVGFFPTGVSLTLGAVTANLTATNGLFGDPTQLGTNFANEPITITFNPPVYGVSGNYYLTDFNFNPIPGNITVVYSDGTTDSASVTSATDFFGYIAPNSLISSIILSTTTPPNAWVTLDNLNIATNPSCLTETLNLTINTTVTPTFTAVAAICSGATLSPLPTTSNNGIMGTWAPPLDNTNTTTYSFTPNIGQCATTATMTITVNSIPVVDIAPPASACEGDTTTITATVSPVSTINGFTGVYDVANWTFTNTNANGTVNISGAPSSIALTSGNNGSDAAGNTDFTITMPTNASISFNWSYTTIDGAQFDIPRVLVNGTPTVMTGYSTSDGTTPQSGSMTLSVNAGDTFSFNMNTTDNLFGPATVTVSNLVISSLPTLLWTATAGGTIVGANNGLSVNVTTSGSYTLTATNGTCVGSDTVSAVFNPVVTPTFNPVAAICEGGALSPLPTASLNGINGSWLPVLDNTTTTTYTFTPDSGQCASTVTLTIVVNPIVTPTFTQVAPICVGGTLSPLPTTSNNGVIGSWSPALDPAVTTTYTFTPDAGQCVDATVVTMTIVVNPLPTVGFTANPFPICAGTSTVLTANVTNATPTVSTSSQTFNMNPALFGVPVTSSLPGVLALAPSNGCTAFTPGLFAGKIALIQRGGCPFTVKALNAQNAGAIGVILYNNVAGAIIPAGVDPTVTIPVYGMTLADGQALIAAMTANEVNITLTPAPPITYLWGNGETTQSITTGVLNADTNFTVTVTNTVTGCVATVPITVPVTPNTIPTFTQVADICVGGTLAPLPLTSDNGIVGTWSPALDNTMTTTYTFTPTPVAGQCLGTATMTITVNQPTAPVFTQVAPICVGGTATLPATSNNGFTGTWAPAFDNTVTTTYTFTPDAGQCVDATVVTMTIVVNPLPTVGFTANPFPICAGTSTVLTANVTNATPTVSTSSQTFNMNPALFGVPVTSSLPGVLALAPSNGCTAFTPGLFAGKIALIQRGACAFTVKALNAQNAGAIGVILYNNVAGAIIPAGADPTVTIPVYGMTLADGQALIAAMTANEVNVTLTPAPPVTYLWGNGETTQSINTGVLNADTNFTVMVTNTVTGCVATVPITVPVTPNTIPTFTQVADICVGGTLAPLPLTSDNGIVGTWSPALDNTMTTTYTFTPTPVAGQCLGTATMTITVNSATTPTGDANQTISVGNANDATLASIVVSPTNVVWYATQVDAQNGTNPLANTTVLTNGATYYAVNVVGTCSSAPLAVTITVVLGNGEFDNLSFVFWPNPTTSIVNISYSKTITQVSVTNVLGQQVMSKNTNATEVQIDLSGLAEATYFIRVQSEDEEKTIKVIKKD